MKKKEQSMEISRRKFLRDSGLLVGGAVTGSAGIFSACNNGEVATQTVTSTEKVTRLICPYCLPEKVFETKEELANHIHRVHAYSNTAPNPRWPIPFCITIGGMTGIGGKTADDVLKEHLYEIEKRGWPPCTLEMPVEGVLSGTYVKELGDAGYEMELDVSALIAMDSAETPYDRQLKVMQEKMDYIEQASGKKVLGARMRASTRTRYTYLICEELGVKWYHLSGLHDYMQYQATAAYKHPDYNLAICPRPSLAYFNKDGDCCSGYDPCVCSFPGEDVFAGAYF